MNGAIRFLVAPAVGVALGLAIGAGSRVDLQDVAARFGWSNDVAVRLHHTDGLSMSRTPTDDATYYRFNGVVVSPSRNLHVYNWDGKHPGEFMGLSSWNLGGESFDEPAESVAQALASVLAGHPCAAPKLLDERTVVVHRCKSKDRV